jgi:ABC-2 type transport system permease protein
MIGVLLLTIRELRARLVILGLFVIATFVWLVLALVVNLEVVDGQLEAFRLFGQAQPTEHEVTVINPETGEQEVHTFQPFGADPLRGFVVGVQQFVAGITFWVIIFLGLFATGSLVSTMQERGQIGLLLSKPLARPTVLAGRLLGVGAVVGLLVLYVLAAVWLVISIKSGIWNPSFLLGAAVILLMFGVMYSIITLMSVVADSSALALLTTLGVVIVSLIVSGASNPEVVELLSEPWRSVYVGLYHVLPNFPDATSAVIDLVGGEPIQNWTPLLTSAAFGVVLYGLAFWRFQRRDF